MAEATAVGSAQSAPPILGSRDDPSFPWRSLVGPDTLAIDVPQNEEDGATLRRIQTLPAGTALLLSLQSVSSRQRIRRFARRAGVRLAREYVAIPSLAPPTCYVETAPQAVRYFLSRVLTLPRGGFAASALVAGVKAVSRFGASRALFSAISPARVALATKVDEPVRDAKSERSSELLDVPGMRTVVLALSKDPNAKLTVLLIPGSGWEPNFAVKVATTDSAAAAIAAERRVLGGLTAILPDGVLSTIPRLAELESVSAQSHLVTTALRGTPMTSRYHSWRHLSSERAVGKDFAMAESWMAEFQATGTGEASPIDVDGGADHVLAERFELEQGFEHTMDRVRAIRKRLQAECTPRTAVHGDFWFGNLLCAGHKITGVVDWEAGAISGEPVRDMARFALSYALYLDRHTRRGQSVVGHRGLKAGVWGAGIEYAINGQGWFPDLFSSFLRNGLVRLGADPACWRDAALAGLVDIAATADHIDFARLHWQLFARLAG